MSPLIGNSRNFYRQLVLYTGFAVSGGLLVYILARINWELFIATLATLNVFWLIASGFLILVGVYIRSFRWNLITEEDTKNFRFFWESANLGYLGNLIYPARAGEIIRIIALNRLTALPEGRIIASAIVDRLTDGLMLPLFIGILFLYVGKKIDIPEAVYFFAMVFVVLSLFLVFFIRWGRKYEEKIFRFFVWFPSTWVEALSRSYSSIHGGASTLTDPFRFSKVAILTIIAFLTDTATFFTLFISFGWNLPVVAAIILCIFIFAGSALPSVPGYFGIYQIACILALYSFGISATAAVAYSLVMQGISYGLFLSIGGWIIFKTGISLRKMKKQINKPSD
jgi:uncharacterized protein (TIRG00374 family)